MELEPALRFEMNQLVSYDDESLMIELRRVAKLIPEQVITQPRYKRHGRASVSVFVRRFGGWQQALDRAGLGDRYSGVPVSEKMLDQRTRGLSPDDVLVELKRIAELIGTTVLRREDILAHSDMLGQKMINSRFGTWKAALEAAGLTISPKGRRWKDDDYFENLLGVWTHYGRVPKSAEMDHQPSRISSGGYIAKFGSWGKAKLAFVNRMNANPDDLEERVQPVANFERVTSRPKIEDLHQIPLGIRYKVLSRDRFRCVSCGNSPAMNEGCVLHVDHILAFSRGGKTRLDNLQSLCATCNVGKGDR